MIDLVDSFLHRSLEAAGAVVNADDGILHALLPAELATSLGVEEEVRLSAVQPCESAPSEPPIVASDTLALAGLGNPDRRAGADRVVDASLGSAFLDRLITERMSRPVLAAIALQAELPRSLPKDVPVLLNAVARGEPERRRRPARYAVADLLLTLQSDEVRSAVASASIRLEDGRHVAPLALAPGSWAAASTAEERMLSPAERATLARSLRAWVSRHGLAPFASTLEGIARRARRDLERLTDYYRSLDVDMARATRRARSTEEKARRQAKRELLPTELQARKEQLRERLRPRLAARLLALRLVETEVDEFTLPVQRRVRTGSVALLRRSGDGRIEGPDCAACGEEALRLYLCDERLHVLCRECGQEGRLDALRCAACTPKRGGHMYAHAASRSIVVADGRAAES